MEAPEKIYLNPIQDALTEMLSTKIDGDIEYILKDTFIEKACEWLRKGGRGWYLTSEFGENEIDFVKLAEDFRKAMEE